VTWTDDRILEAATQWVWWPESAPRVVTDEYTVVAYPEHFAQPTQVFRTRSSRSAAELVTEVLGHVRDLGRSSASWWVDAGTRPTELEDLLRRRGGEPRETVSVLAFDMADGLPDLALPADVTTSVVSDEAGLSAWVAVNSGAWHAPVPPREELDRMLAELQRGEAGAELRVLAWRAGEPFGMGGCTVVDGVARLWGAATLPGMRGLGGYRAVLFERMRLAREHGATLALVKGRVSTSAPILRRAGFRLMGQERAYDVEV
jgi:hypothetical protein